MTMNKRISRLEKQRTVEHATSEPTFLLADSLEQLVETLEMSNLRAQAGYETDP